MPSKPVRRKTSKRDRSRDRDQGSASVTESLKRLIEVGPYHRNEIGISRINRIRDLIDQFGFSKAAEMLGLSEAPMLKTIGGFGHKLRPDTAAKIRSFFGE
jgi:hypothetical protein